MTTLRLNALGQLTKLRHRALDLFPGNIEFDAAHHRCGPRKFAARTVGNGEDHPEIAQQVRRFRRRSRRLRRLLGFQEQQRVLQNPLTDGHTAVAPGHIELTGLPAQNPITRQRIGHPLTILQARSRHGYENLSTLDPELGLRDVPR
jgi:hypothetical protein